MSWDDGKMLNKIQFKQLSLIFYTYIKVPLKANAMFICTQQWILWWTGDVALTREILHQSMLNWALNFLSQLMTGSISWLQRSWFCGVSTSRRHDENGTSAPTITYTLWTSQRIHEEQAFKHNVHKYSLTLNITMMHRNKA